MRLFIHTKEEGTKIIYPEDNIIGVILEEQDRINIENMKEEATIYSTYAEEVFSKEEARNVLREIKKGD